MCMWFGFNPAVNFCHFSTLLTLSVFAGATSTSPKFDLFFSINWDGSKQLTMDNLMLCHDLCKEFPITTRKRARYAPESLCVVHVNKDSDSLKQ